MSACLSVCLYVSEGVCGVSYLDEEWWRRSAREVDRGREDDRGQVGVMPVDGVAREVGGMPVGAVARKVGLVRDRARACMTKGGLLYWQGWGCWS